MQFYCEGCGKNHEFTPREVEQLVYVLQGELASSLTADPEHEYYKQFREMPESEVLNSLCFQDLLNTGTDQEAYGEHVAGLADARRALMGVTRCDECGSDCDKTGHCGECAKAAERPEWDTDESPLGEVDGTDDATDAD